MTGKNLIQIGDKFAKLFQLQSLFQDAIEGTSPHDNPIKFQYHMTAMQEELGEVLKADKRWKTHRNTSYIPDEKLDEISDCFITLMNVSMWSGFSADEILSGIEKKIAENYKRIEGEK
jgi:hypothetical protein